MLKKVSIIIPVYNAENTIGKCVDSVLRNSFKDWELVLIDDGSKDNSWHIMQEYAEKYSEKIRIFTQENSGVAIARNRGIGYAQGEYVAFIDNDDYVDEDHLAKFVEEIEKYDCDMVIGGYRRTTEEKTLFEMKLQNTEWSKYMIMAPWAKIYRRDFLLQNKLEFLDNNIGEDVYFNLAAVNLTNKILIIDYCGYNWFYNTESVSNAKQKKISNKLNVMKVLEGCHARLREIGAENKKLNEFYFVRYAIWYLLFAGRQSSYGELLAEFETAFTWLKNNYPTFAKNENISLFRPKGETLRNKVAVYFFMLFYRFGAAKVLLKIYAGKKD